MARQSTVASIQNIRKQRQLELELVELDRKWHVELKVIARERLSLVKELCRLNQDIQDVDHFRGSLRGRALVRHTTRAQHRLQLHKDLKEIHKFDFQPDPVQKMNLQLPLIKEEGGGGGGGGSDGDYNGGDAGKVLMSKDLYKHRVQLQKSNSEQCNADRRSRRRPFLDKAIIGSHNHKAAKDRNGFYRQQRGGGLGLSTGTGSGLGQTWQVHQHPRDTKDEEDDDDEEDEMPVRHLRGLSKSPSLPALNRLRRLDTFKVNAIHPSLSKRHSASMDYLPVIRNTRGRPGQIKSSRETSIISSSGLPTIVES